MLPLLLFAGAFLLDLDHLVREKLPVAVLSILGTILSVFAVAGLMLLVSGTGARWMECLIFGALISPTDPIAVLELLRRIGIPKPIEAQLAGESLFNDGVGAVLFLTMIDIARGQSPTAWHIGGILLLKAGGAMVLGIAAAWLISHLMCLVDSYQVEILLTLALALGGYVLADTASSRPRWRPSWPASRSAISIANSPQVASPMTSVDEFWTLLDEVQNSLLFVLLGLEVMVVTVNAMTVRAGLAAIVSRESRAVRGGGVVPVAGSPLPARSQWVYPDAHLGWPAWRPFHRSCPVGSTGSRRDTDGLLDFRRDLHRCRVLDHSPGRIAAICASAKTPASGHGSQLAFNSGPELVCLDSRESS